MSNPRKIGKPTLLNPELQERFIHAILKGASYEIASDYAGCDYTTYRLWMIRGEEEGEGIYFDFFKAVKKAKGEAALKWLRHIDDAMEDDNWQAAAWKLERRYWKDYSKHVETLGIGEMAEKVQDRINQGAISNGKINHDETEQNTEE